ncbi:MAG: hypothetical protein ACO1RT_02525, partial [Planctomycetaceae bacterium]
LGELPPPGGDSRTVRMIDASPTPDTLEYLRRLKEQFRRLSPNEIELPDEDAFVPPAKATSPEIEEDSAPASENKALPAEPQEKEEKPKSKDRAKGTVTHDHQAATYQFAALQSGEPVADESELDAEEPDAEELPQIKSAEDFDRAFAAPSRGQARAPRPSAGAPIRIELDQAGNLVLSSEDTEALDRLEGLMLQFAPPKRPYRVFKIEYASASWMRLNLEDYFKDMDSEEDSDADSFFRWYWGSGDDEDKKEPTGLGKGNKLRFVDDIDTNTIVVNGADAEQLKTIEELIELWDVPEPVNKRKTRFTRLVPIQFGKAEKIADTVKDAYRDLLSSNDKAFQQQNRGQSGSGTDRRDTPRNRNGNGSDLVDTAGSRESGGSDYTFKGKLSVGIDEVGNTLLISAEGEPLLDLVCDMIKQLDEASRPSGDVQVVKLSGAISAQSLEAALRAFGASSKAPTAEASSPAPRARPSADEAGDDSPTP